MNLHKQVINWTKNMMNFQHFTASQQLLYFLVHVDGLCDNVN